MDVAIVTQSGGPLMSVALLFVCALNLVVSGAALMQAHRAFQANATVVQLLRQASKRRG